MKFFKKMSKFEQSNWKSGAILGSLLFQLKVNLTASTATLKSLKF